MTNRNTKAARLERAGYRHVSGWLPEFAAHLVWEDIWYHEADVERAAETQGKRGRPRKKAEGMIITGWQPMDTAPKDGRYVMLRNRDDEGGDCAWPFRWSAETADWEMTMVHDDEGRVTLVWNYDSVGDPVGWMDYDDYWPEKQPRLHPA